MTRLQNVRWRAAFLGIACALLSCGISNVVTAADSPVSIEKVKVGFNGVYKVGCWTPIVVEVAAGSAVQGQLVVDAADPDGNLVSMPNSAQQLSAGKHQLRGLFRAGRLTDSIRVRIVSAEGETLAVAEPEVANFDDTIPLRFKQSAYLVATIGKPAGLPNAEPEESDGEDAAPEAGSEVFQTTELESFDALPVNAAGFASLDLLVISGKYNATREQSERIRDWVKTGGNVVVSVGSGSALFQEGELDLWVPVTFGEKVTLRELGVLEGYVGRGSRLLRAGETVPSARMTVKEGETLIAGFDGPLVMRAPVGLGQVTVIAVDLDKPPLSSWPSVDHLVRRLIGSSRDAAAMRNRDRSAALGQTGMTDLATQFLRTSDEFETVRRVSTWTVMGLMLLYLIIIGPIDYLVVHRLLKRPRWTWVTFPLMVTLATWLTTSAASATNGATLQVNEIGVVDIDAATDTARVQSWATVYSPETRRYKVSLDPVSIVKREAQPVSPLGGSPLNSWRGIPEDTYGGMYRLGGIDFGHAGYSTAPDAPRIENLPISIWSTKSIASTWQGTMAGAIEADLSSRGPGHLSGTLRHFFPTPLNDWIVAHGRQVYRPVANARTNPEAKLAPLERWSVADASPRELEGYLTGTTQEYRDTKVSEIVELVRQQVPYDKSRRDPGYVLRMLTFYQAAGGIQYTGLEHRAMRSFDLTPLLALNRAVLLGRIETPAAEVRVNDEVQQAGKQWTFVRVVLPVKNLRASGTGPVNNESAGDAGAGVPSGGD